MLMMPQPVDVCLKFSGLGGTSSDQLLHKGPEFGYFPNQSKTCVIVKEQFYDKAVRIFQGSVVSVTAEGTEATSGGGLTSFVNSFVQGRVSTWIKELHLLSDISITHPHAAYAGFVHGFIGKWNFLMRCIPDIESSLAPLETFI